uniref:AT-hook motif nuclear-localized protein 14 n=1 Tax=Rhizophora mucronata TaxID=61149 RepID=A0A2P2K786_RHIMU
MILSASMHYLLRILYFAVCLLFNSLKLVAHHISVKFYLLIKLCSFHIFLFGIFMFLSLVDVFLIKYLLESNKDTHGNMFDEW